jgi:hypothetical protein
MEFFDREGSAIAYSLDGKHIYDWDGKPSAFIRSNKVYNYSGRFIAWLSNGWIWDRSGYAVLFSQEATGGPLKPLKHLKPLKGLRELRPLKGLAELPPPRPLFTLEWSDSPWDGL